MRHRSEGFDEISGLDGFVVELLASVCVGPYYVRGDLVFDDDSVVMLDELCARVGLAPLPLLEPMPDELDILFDEAAPGTVRAMRLLRPRRILESEASDLAPYLVEVERESTHSRDLGRALAGL